MKKIKQIFTSFLTIASTLFGCIGFSNLKINPYDLVASKINTDCRLEIYGKNGKNLGYETDWLFHKFSTYHQFRTFDIYYESLSTNLNSPVIFNDSPVNVLINTYNDLNHFKVNLLEGSYPSSYPSNVGSSEIMCDELLFESLMLPHSFPVSYKFSEIKNSTLIENELVITGIFKNDQKNSYLNSSDSLGNKIYFSMITNNFEFKLYRPNFKAIVKIPKTSNKFAISSIFDYFSQKDDVIDYRFYESFISFEENVSISNLLNLETKEQELSNYKNNYSLLYIALSILCILLMFTILVLSKNDYGSKGLFFMQGLLIVVGILILEILSPLFVSKYSLFLVNDVGAVLTVLLLLIISFVTWLILKRKEFKQKNEVIKI